MNKAVISLLLRLDTWAFISCIIFFIVFPRVDLAAAALFYDEQTRFYINEWLSIHVIYRFFAYIQFPILFYLIWRIVAHHRNRRFQIKRKFVYLLCCLIIGPGLLVNIFLKDNSLGRPRPRQIENFGGQHEYAKPFEYSGACKKNCSFTSGHASIGFMLIALFWTTRRREYFYAGIALGLLLGLMRVAQGGHFPSDVVFSFWVIYFSALGLSRLLSLRSTAKAPNSDIY